MHKILFVIISSLILLSCNNTTEPKYSGPIRLILSADKTFGMDPLTVKFSGGIIGNTEEVVGQVPDYIFFPQIGKTAIRYSIPDTSQALVTTWSDEKTYPAGEYKVVLLYQGRKDSSSFDLLSDTLLITVN